MAAGEESASDDMMIFSADHFDRTACHEGMIYVHLSNAGRYVKPDWMLVVWRAAADNNLHSNVSSDAKQR